MIPIEVIYGYVHGGTEIWYYDDASPVNSYVTCNYDKNERESR
jgi:hypothetical protein